MDLRQLRYFLSIVDEGSFSKAATRLRVAQPSLSLHVKNMEQELGVVLLLRGVTGVSPTESGALLVQKARAILDDFARMQDEVSNLGREPGGTVRLGLPGTISDILAAPLIARCYIRFPKIKIIIAEAMSGFVKEWLHEGRVDFAVLYTDLGESGTRSQALLKEELVLLMPPDTPDCDRAAFEILADAALILPTNSHGLRMMLDKEFHAKAMTLEPIIEVDSYGNIKQLVEEGYGVSVLPYHAVAAEAEQGKLRLKRFCEPRLWRGVYLTNLSTRTKTQAALVVEALLIEIIEDLVTNGKWAGGRLPKSRLD